MNRPSFRLRLLLFLLLLTGPSLHATESAPEASENIVTYEQFGAVGDGITDDLPAIVAAHAHANKLGLPVRANPRATYHLGSQALTAIIQTSTDWNTSRFIIDDSQAPEDHSRELFIVQSSLAPVPLKLERLTDGQDRLDVQPESDLFVYVENENLRRFIRRGANVDTGTTQREAFILRQDGTIDGAIQWDYEEITTVEARPIDPEPLTLRGGFFIHIPNQTDKVDGSRYWARNILVSRSNTIVDGITREVAGHTDIGLPYRGFLSVHKAADITVQNCRVEPHKFYWMRSDAGVLGPMGTYGYNFNSVVNLTIRGCVMTDIHDHSRWGVVGANFLKNVLVEDSVLSRMDVHMGVSGYYIIRNSTMGHMGINAIGRGKLLVENTTVHSQHLINFRRDYGATWDGDVVVRNSRWVPSESFDKLPMSMFGVQNDGTHEFGYACTMPTTIRVEGLTIDDKPARAAGFDIVLFDDASGAVDPDLPYFYKPSEKVEFIDLETTSGLTPRVSDNPKVVEAISVTGL
jgi:hypothetical protein